MTNAINTTVANELYPVANAIASSNPFVDQFNSRDPTPQDINYPIQKKWLNTATEAFWELQNFMTSQGVTTAHWVLIGSHSLVTETLTGNSGGAVPPTLNNINVVGDGTFITTVGNPGTSTLTIEPAGGLATLYTEDSGTAVPAAGNLNVFGGTGISTTGAGNTITINALGTVPLQFTEDSGTAVPSGNNLNIFGANGIHTSGAGSTVTISGIGFAFNYTNVDHAHSPYTVLTTDYYISVDCSGGTVTLKFPNAPAFKQEWIIKDRTGNASTNHISVTTVGGAVNIDGQTTYLITSNYGAINLLANATPTYEVY